MKDEEKQKVVSLAFPQKLIDRIDEVRDKSRSKYVREAVEEKLEGEEAKKDG